VAATTTIAASTIKVIVATGETTGADDRLAFCDRSERCEAFAVFPRAVIRFSESVRNVWSADSK